MGWVTYLNMVTIVVLWAYEGINILPYSRVPQSNQGLNRFEYPGLYQLNP